MVKSLCSGLQTNNLSNDEEEKMDEDVCNTPVRLHPKKVSISK